MLSTASCVIACMIAWQTCRVVFFFPFFLKMTVLHWRFEVWWQIKKKFGSNNQFIVMEVEWWSFNLCQGLHCHVRQGNNDERSLYLLLQKLAVLWRKQVCKQIIAIMCYRTCYNEQKQDRDTKKHRIGKLDSVGWVQRSQWFHKHACNQDLTLTIYADVS